MRSRAVGALVAASFAVASSASSACKRDVKRVIESDPATAPNAAKWTRANVDVIYEPARYSAHGGSSARVTYWLRLAGPAGDKSFEIEHFFAGSGAIDAPFDVPSADFDAMRATKPRVRLAPDGHALAVSRDGAHYRYVALDSGEMFLYCRHVAFAADASGDPWGSAPTTRALALGVLRSSSVGPQTAASHYTTIGSRVAFEEETHAATAFACAHRDDVELRAALVAAPVLPGDQIWSSSVFDEELACVSEIARSDATVRAFLLPTIRAQETAMRHQAENAARALATSDDAHVQDALAEALALPAAMQTVPTSSGGTPGDCFLRAALTWSLASVTTLRGQASNAVVAAFSTIASAPDPCPSGLGGKIARVYAVRGLAAIATPHASDALRVIAAPACESPIASWPTAFVRWNEGTETSEGTGNVACWARAALDRRPHVDAGARPAATR